MNSFYQLFSCSPLSVGIPSNVTINQTTNLTHFVNLQINNAITGVRLFARFGTGETPSWQFVRLVSSNGVFAELDPLFIPSPSSGTLSFYDFAFRNTTSFSIPPDGLVELWMKVTPTHAMVLCSVSPPAIHHVYGWMNPQPFGVQDQVVCFGLLPTRLFRFVSNFRISKL